MTDTGTTAMHVEEEMPFPMDDFMTEDDYKELAESIGKLLDDIDTNEDLDADSVLIPIRLEKDHIRDGDWRGQISTDLKTELLQHGIKVVFCRFTTFGIVVTPANPRTDVEAMEKIDKVEVMGKSRRMRKFYENLYHDFEIIIPDIRHHKTGIIIPKEVWELALQKFGKIQKVDYIEEKVEGQGTSVFKPTIRALYVGKPRILPGRWPPQIYLPKTGKDGKIVLYHSAQYRVFINTELPTEICPDCKISMEDIMLEMDKAERAGGKRVHMCVVGPRIGRPNKRKRCQIARQTITRGSEEHKKLEAEKAAEQQREDLGMQAKRQKSKPPAAAPEADTETVPETVPETTETVPETTETAPETDSAGTALEANAAALLAMDWSAEPGAAPEAAVPADTAAPAEATTKSASEAALEAVAPATDNEMELESLLGDTTPDESVHLDTELNQLILENDGFETVAKRKAAHRPTTHLTPDAQKIKSRVPNKGSPSGNPFSTLQEK